MNNIIIPKKIASKDDLVVVPRKEYEALLEFKNFREFTPTAAQKKALARAEQNLRKGKTLSYTHQERQLQRLEREMKEIKEALVL